MLKINSKDKIYIKQIENTTPYDGHCLRAWHYMPEKMPLIKEKLDKATTPQEKVDAINSIKSLYKEVRQESKSPTFALT